MMDVTFLLCLCTVFSHQVAACLEGCECERGILWCVNRNISVFPQLSTIPAIARRLKFNKNSIKSITLSDKDVTYHPQVTLLDMNHNKLATLPSYNDLVLIGFSQLQKLLLGHNIILYIAHDAFKGLHQLQKLHLDNNHLTKVVDSWFDPLESLRFLYLYDNMISTFEPGNFIWPDGLMKVYLHNNKIKSIPPLPIKDCSKTENTSCIGTEIDLQGNEIYCGCRRPEHDKTILKRTLPAVYLCCADVPKKCNEILLNHWNYPWKSIERTASSTFFQTYVEQPVCSEPSVKLHTNNKEQGMCVANGRPTPEVRMYRGCLSQYQADDPQQWLRQKMVVICEAENLFGMKSQMFHFDSNSCKNQSLPHENEKWVCTLNKSQILPFWLLLPCVSQH